MVLCFLGDCLYFGEIHTVVFRVNYVYNLPSNGSREKSLYKYVHIDQNMHINTHTYTYTH